MLDALYSRLEQQSPAAVVIIVIAIMLLTGFLMTRITKKLKLPNVTAYIVTGILIGPFCLDCVPRSFIDESAFLADIALAFIAFSTGQFLKFSKLRKNAGKVIVITLAESLTASVLVFAAAFWILRLNLAFSIVLSALAAATAPASTLMIIRQTKSRGDLVDTLLQAIAYDNITALMGYSIAISIALSHVSGVSVRMQDILLPIARNLGAMALGGLFGVTMKLLIQKKRSTDNRLIILIALLFAFCGVCAAAGVSPLLGCMSMGSVYISLTDDDKLFKQLNYFSPPTLLLFFVRSGVVFGFNFQGTPSGTLDGVPLLLIALTYFLVRIIGKFSGAFLGCLAVNKPESTRNFFGLALIPQAGVAIGLAALGARALGGSMGTALETVILGASVLYELIGPACAKLALYLSGSYSSKLEELVEVPETDAKGMQKTSAELLIERIQKIQQELAREESAVSEEEHAFTEAAEAQDSHLLDDF